MLKIDKNTKISELNQKLEIELDNVKVCMEKIKQLSEYLSSARKLIKINFEEGSTHNIHDKDNIKDSIMSDENLLKPIKESELDESRGLFNLSPDSDKFTQKNNNSSDDKTKEIKYLKTNISKIEADISRSEIEIIHEEIIALIKETKLMFSVVDKILPRKENDAICYLLEFENKFKPNNIKEEIEAIIYDNEDIHEFSIGKSIRELRKLKQNIINLRQKCFDMF